MHHARIEVKEPHVQSVSKKVIFFYFPRFSTDVWVIPPLRLFATLNYEEYQRVVLPWSTWSWWWQLVRGLYQTHLDSNQPSSTKKRLISALSHFNLFLMANSQSTIREFKSYLHPAIWNSPWLPGSFLDDFRFAPVNRHSIRHTQIRGNSWNYAFCYWFGASLRLFFYFLFFLVLFSYYFSDFLADFDYFDSAITFL